MMKQFTMAVAFVAGIFISLASSGASAQEQSKEAGWIKDQNGCNHYNPSPQSNEKLTWSGGCKNGYAEGEGIVEWFVDDKLIERFEGEYKRGKPDGKGAIVSWEHGEERYEGDWKDGAPNGNGKVTFPDGSVYTGELKNWRPEGRGERINPDGSHEFGDWEDGELVKPIEK